MHNWALTLFAMFETLLLYALSVKRDEYWTQSVNFITQPQLKRCECSVVSNLGRGKFTTKVMKIVMSGAIVMYTCNNSVCTS